MWIYVKWVNMCEPVMCVYERSEMATERDNNKTICDILMNKLVYDDVRLNIKNKHNAELHDGQNGFSLFSSF